MLACNIWMSLCNVLNKVCLRATRVLWDVYIISHIYKLWCWCLSLSGSLSCHCCHALSWLFLFNVVLACTGLSLKSQELTAMFLAVRLYCSFVMEYDIHTLLDLATLATTLWVIYMIRFKLKASYMEDKDNFAIYYVVSLLLLMPV